MSVAGALGGPVGAVGAVTAILAAAISAAVAPTAAAVPAVNAVVVAVGGLWLAAGGRWAGRAVVRARVRRRLPARDGDRAAAGPAGLGVAGEGWTPQWFRERATSMALATAPALLWRRWCILVPVVVVAGAAVGGPVGALLAAAGTLVLPLIAGDVLAGRADRLVEAGLPGLLDQVGGGLRAGLSPAVALRDAVPALDGPLRDDIARLCASLDAGLPVGAALGRWRRHRPTPSVALAATALSLSAVLGGRSRPLDGVASTLRDRLAVDREVRAVCAQSRASAAVLVVLPWAFTVYAAAQDPASLTVFTDSAIGVGCLLVGAALDVAGAWIMVRLVGRLS